MSFDLTGVRPTEIIYLPTRTYQKDVFIHVNG